MHKPHEPKALWFGRGPSRCFGTLHQPAILSDRGVVLCDTFGFDGLIAYRALRHLAEAGTERGFWSLRIDYDGEGDSAGGPWEPNRLEAWIRSIDAAVGVLRSRGVSDIRLVGYRAGALLAHRYATTHPGISGLVLWWPTASGAAYVRELRALSKLSAAARPVQRVMADRFPEDSLEVCGFEFAAQTLVDLAAIDLVAAPCTVRPPSVLLIDRSDTAPNDLLVRKLVDLGSDVEHEQMSGYEEFMTDDELKSVAPLKTLHRIVDWLDNANAAVPNADSLVVADVAVAAVVETNMLSIQDPTAGRFPPPGPARDEVIEEPAWVDDRLFAIISRPAGRAPIRRASIVLCTTGANNRVGPGRLYVLLARYWASLGFTVVRIDLGGAGDSVSVDPLTQIQAHAPTCIDEIRETVTWVQTRTGFDSVVLFGLCSGAFNAFHAAVDGVDIRHAMLVNPGIFYLGADDTASTSTETSLWAAHSLGRGLVSPRKWRLVLREQGIRHGLAHVGDLLRAGATDGLGFAFGAMARNAARRVGLRVDAPSSLPTDLEKIAARGVKVLMIFSAGESTPRYVRMFGGRALEALLRSDRVQLVEIDGGDHVFSSPGSRQRLFEESTEFLDREYPLASPPVATTVLDSPA
jgi:alpha-beta hydrolase superfamily lysophospholipase